MVIIIKNWEKYNGRKDIKKPWWFKLSNTLLEDSQFYSMTGEEIKAWIYLLSQASKHQSGAVYLDEDHATRVCWVKIDGLKSLLKKLEQYQIISKNPYAIRTRSVQQIRLEEIRLEEKESVNSAKPSHTLLKIWNENCGELAKIRGIGKSRARLVKMRWEENPNPEYWKEVIVKITKTPFCCGKNNRGWKASFDFLIKSDTHYKVLEGAYDNGPQKTIRIEAEDWGKM